MTERELVARPFNLDLAGLEEHIERLGCTGCLSGQASGPALKFYCMGSTIFVGCSSIGNSALSHFTSGFVALNMPNGLSLNSHA